MLPAEGSLSSRESKAAGTKGPARRRRSPPGGAGRQPWPNPCLAMSDRTPTIRSLCTSSIPGLVQACLWSRTAGQAIVEASVDLVSKKKGKFVMTTR